MNVPISAEQRIRIPDGVFAAAACFLWSSAFVAIKAGYASGVGPFFFVGLRFFASGLVLLPLAMRSAGGIGLVRLWKTHGGYIFVVGILQTALTYGAFYLGVGMVPASVAAIVIGAQPLLTSAASHFAPPSERLVPRQWVALVIGIGGLAVLSLSRESPLADENRYSGEILGIVLLLAALGAASAANILVSRTKRAVPALALSAGQFLSGGALLLLASMILETPIDFAPDGTFFLALGWLILVSSVGVTLWFWLLTGRKAGPGALSVWKFIIPASGALLSWILIPGDAPDAGSLTGMTLIVAAVLIFFGAFGPARRTSRRG